MSSRFGFLDFGTTDSSVLIQAALTSASDLDGGVVGGAGAASVDYTADGVKLNATSGINWYAALTAAQRTAISEAFTFTAWVESGWISGVAPSLEHLFALYGTSYQGISKENAGVRLAYHTSAGFPTTTRAYVSSADKGTHTRFDWVKSGDQLTLYVDYFPVVRYSINIADAGALSHIGLGGPNTSAIATYRIKNFMLSNRAIAIPSLASISDITMLGHSFGANGNYATTDFNAFVPDANGIQGAQTTYDLRTLPTIHRELGRRGINIKPFIRNFSVAATFVNGGANDLGAQITTALSSSNRFKVVLLQFGTNEVTAGTTTLAATYPSLQADYQTEITNLVTNGATKILIGNSISTANDTTYGTAGASWAAYQSRTNDFNTIVDALVAANPTTCHKVDLFSAFGGHSVTAADFTTNDRHPSNQGYGKIGREFAKVILAAL